MKRPLPEDARPGRHEPDIKKAFSKAQLAEIGAIALIWNQIEGTINFLILVGILPPLSVWHDLTTRITGAPAKVELLRFRAERAKILTDAARKSIKYTLDAVTEYKKLRDLIIHCVPYDVSRKIGITYYRKSEATQVLLSTPALRALYRRMELLLKELPEIDLLYRLADEDGAWQIYGRGLSGRFNFPVPGEPDPLELRRTQDVPKQMVRVRKAQKARRSLGPLPKFPDESAALPTTAEPEIPAGSEETD
jgi:hypothetical protein